MITATVHRPNMGSLSYVWIGNTEHVCGTTSDVFALLRRRGTPIQTGYTQSHGGSVTSFIIEPRTGSDDQ